MDCTPSLMTGIKKLVLSSLKVSKYQNKLHRERERERERENAFCGCWKNGEGIMHQDLKRHSDDASLEQEYYYWEKRRLEM